MTQDMMEFANSVERVHQSAEEHVGHGEKKENTARENTWENSSNCSEKDDDGTAITKTKGGVPLDHGWAWLVLLGAALEMTIYIGLAKSSGLLFVAFQDRFKSSSSQTSLISTVQNAVYSVSALIVMTVFIKRFTCRTLVFFGSTLVCISYIITSQASDIRVLLLSHGVLQGFGAAFMQPTTLTMLGQYFDRRRGFANSVAVSGGSFGGLILAPLITVLLSHYGYQGCMMILAGLIFNVCISAALFRSPEFFTKRTINEDETSQKEEKLLELINKTNSQTMDLKIISCNKEYLSNDNGKGISPNVVFTSPVINGLRNEYKLKDRSISGTNEDSINGVEPRLLGSEPLIAMDSTSPKFYRRRTYTETSMTRRVFKAITTDDKSNHMSREFMAGSYMDIPGFDDHRHRHDGSEKSIDGVNNKKEKRSVLKYLTNLFDITLFKDPVFVLMQTAFGLSCSGYALTTVFIAPYAVEVGIDKQDVAKVITIFSAIDLCSRIAIGVIADLKVVRPSTILFICAMVISASSFVLKFFTSFGLIVFYAVILGLFAGGHFALFAVVIVDFMTLPKLQSCLGFTTLFHGSFVAIGFFTAGVLRDSTGSYIASFYFLGTEIFIAGCLLFSLPYVEKLRGKRQSRDTDSIQIVPASTS